MLGFLLVLQAMMPGIMVGLTRRTVWRRHSAAFVDYGSCIFLGGGPSRCIPFVCRQFCRQVFSGWFCWRPCILRCVLRLAGGPNFRYHGRYGLKEGPHDFHGYRYFYVCLFLDGCGFQANLVEIYVYFFCAPLRWCEEDLGRCVSFVVVRPMMLVSMARGTDILRD